MKKPNQSGYSVQNTLNCERVLVTLLRGLGPWKDSVFLVGGLTPRYLVKDKPPEVPDHAGTMDVDIVIDVQILAETSCYNTLEENLRKMNFRRSVNNQGQKLSWQWETRMEDGSRMLVEFLTDNQNARGGHAKQLPTSGNISALNIPYSSIVFDLYKTTKIRAELLGNEGIAAENLRHANLVSFTCLKAFAYDQRFERKDAYDLLYCIEFAGKNRLDIALMFSDALKGRHSEVILKALQILRNRFAGDEKTEGYQKDGPTAVAQFELSMEDIGDSLNEALALRRREVNIIIEDLLNHIDRIK